MKKKTILSLAALCMAVAANATIIRVSNVNGSSAPYSTIQAAVDAASVGDTIMVDGSNTEYAETHIDKRLVVIGPGYWINENGMVQEAVPSVNARFVIHVDAPGTVIEGFAFRNHIGITICADNCVVRRCYFWNHGSYKAIEFSRDKVNGEYIEKAPKGAVIHQNFFGDCGITLYFYSYEKQMPNVQITNNIFVHNEGSESDINGIENSYIAYNTMIGNSSYWKNFREVYASTIEHNIIKAQEISYPNIHIKDNNEWDDNVVIAPSDVEYKTDKDIRDLELTKDVVSSHGAFAGDSPYVLSGIPAAPVIQDLVMPTTVEKGSKMNVTIKVGIQK